MAGGEPTGKHQSATSSIEEDYQPVPKRWYSDAIGASLERKKDPKAWLYGGSHREGITGQSK